MANGTGYLYRDLGDPQQVPSEDLDGEDPRVLYLPIAKVLPAFVMERVSIADLLTYLNTNLVFASKIEELLNADAVLGSRISTVEREDRELLSNVETNAGNIGTLMNRVVALEAEVRPGGGSAVAPDSQLDFGVMDAAGAKVAGTEMHAEFHSPAATVTINFPAVAETGQRWWLEYPAGMQIQHMWEEAGGGRQDVISAWGFDSSYRRYTSPPQTAGFQGFYSIAVSTVGGG